MGAEPGFVSSHVPATGTAFVQSSPDIQAVNGEIAVTAGQLMSINPDDGRVYLCDAGSADCVPAGFAAADHPLGTAVDDTSKITLVREGRIGGFTGLVPGAPYYPSADTPGAVVPERAAAGPVITSIAAASGSGFLGNVHIRAGHRPQPGVWTISFPTAVTCRVTAPDGTQGAIATVADAAAYNGSLPGASAFYLETGTLTAGDEAEVTVSYADEAGAALTLDSPGNAVAAIAPLAGMAGKVVTPGCYTIVTTANTGTVGFNGSAQSAARAVSAGEVCLDLIPGCAVTLEVGSITAETNRVIVTAAAPAAQVGVAVNSTTLQVLTGGIG